MGSFSWTRADNLTSRSNFCEGDKYKILVPIEFGGGYIVDEYPQYGIVFEKLVLQDGTWAERKGYYMDANGVKYPASDFPQCDIYGIFAYWNGCEYMNHNRYPGYPKDMISILTYGDTTNDENRRKGIELFFNKKDVKYPLKLVSRCFAGTYESCLGVSYSDPNQGFFRAKWTHPSYVNIKKELDNLYKKEKIEEKEIYVVHKMVVLDKGIEWRVVDKYFHTEEEAKDYMKKKNAYNFDIFKISRLEEYSGE